MSLDQTQRPAFYEQQYLGADDLNAAVEYGRLQQSRHLLGAHTWGVAMGLQLKEKTTAGKTEVYIQPGYAWDGFGRPVVVLSPYKLSEQMFQSFASNGDPQGLPIKIWLRYDEASTRGPQPGFESCDLENAFSRVQETFRVEVGERRTLIEQRSLLSIAGYAIDARDTLATLEPDIAPAPVLYDESVPYQTFPDPADHPRWLIPLGFVRWLPNPSPTLPGTFRERSAADRLDSRAQVRYIGAVTETVTAADSIIRMKSRTRESILTKTSLQTTDDHVADDLVWIEGALRVIGTARLFGGKLDFRSDNGENQDVPNRIERVRFVEPVTLRNKTDLRIIIGKSDDGDNRLAVGPLDNAGNFQSVFSVRDNNGIELGGDDMSPGIGTPYIDFHFNGMIQDYNTRLINDADGRLSVMAATLYASGRIGVGTTSPRTPLHLPQEGLQIGFNGTATENFHIVSDTNGGQRGLRLYNQNFGTGSHILTVLPGGTVGIGTTSPNTALKLDIQGDFGRPNSPVTMFLWGSTIGDIGDGVLFLRSGGNVISMDAADDRFGVGTNVPREKLEVRGHIRLDTDGNLFAAGGLENLRILRGTVNPDGSIVSGSGFSVSHSSLFSPGRYMITFDRPFPSRPSASATQIFPFNGGNRVEDGDFTNDHGDTRDNAVINRLTPLQLGIVTGDANGSNDNRAFTFIVIGPR